MQSLWYFFDVKNGHKCHSHYHSISIWCLSILSLLLSTDRHLMTSKRNHCDCCFAGSHKVTVLWSHIMIFQETVISRLLLLSNHHKYCIVIRHQITLQGRPGSLVSDIWMYNCKATISAKVTVWRYWCSFGIFIIFCRNIRFAACMPQMDMV